MDVKHLEFFFDDNNPFFMAATRFGVNWVQLPFSVKRGREPCTPKNLFFEKKQEKKKAVHGLFPTVSHDAETRESLNVQQNFNGRTFCRSKPANQIRVLPLETVTVTSDGLRLPIGACG